MRYAPSHLSALGTLLFFLPLGFFSPVIAADLKTAPVDALIPWLLQEDHELREIPFSEVVFAATGKRVLALDRKTQADQQIVQRVEDVLNEVMSRMNAADSPIHNVGRINEVSSHFEDLLRDLLNRVPGFRCDFPHTAEERVQRSGYPDLRLIQETTNRVFYLDPKLYASGSRESSFRTFYFEPKITTNKVRDDAVHFVVGFEHASHETGSGPPHAAWKFTR